MNLKVLLLDSGPAETHHKPGVYKGAPMSCRYKAAVVLLPGVGGSILKCYTSGLKSKVIQQLCYGFDFYMYNLQKCHT